MSSLLLTRPVNGREECGEWNGLWSSSSSFLCNRNWITDSLDTKVCSHYNNADTGFSVKEATLHISCARCFFCFPFFPPPVTWFWCWAYTFLATKSMEQPRLELFYGCKGGKKSDVGRPFAAARRPQMLTGKKSPVNEITCLAESFPKVKECQ